MNNREAYKAHGVMQKLGRKREGATFVGGFVVSNVSTQIKATSLELNQEASVNIQ